MRILSFNCRGLANPSKKSSLRRLVEQSSPEVILLQETLGDSVSVVKALETLFPGWMFAAVDARGRSGGLATGWKKRNCKLESVWGFVSGIGLTLFSTDLGRNLTVINIYGPHQDRQIYWNSLAECEWFKDKDFLLGGDLNFSLGASEVWGPRAAQDPLNNFFLNYLDQVGLVDVEPQKLTPTWCNRWVGLTGWPNDWTDFY
jgi:exonuclease III